MGKLIARVAVYGDLHLNSKNYGAHRDYAKESLDYLEMITEIVEQNNVTHLVGLGDFSFGTFNSLAYRDKVDTLLQRQFNATSGNRWEIKGNHDVSTKGMTEYEYYIEKGLIKPAENLSIGNLNITMVNYNEVFKTEPLIVDGAYNVIMAHQYMKFEDTVLPNYGSAIDLDNLTNWYGADIILLGHVHKQIRFDGTINVTGEDGSTKGHRAVVEYLGCPMRPAYREGELDETGKVVLIDVYDNGEIGIGCSEFELYPIDLSFNLELREELSEHKERIHIDISEVVSSLDSHERAVGNPEDIIMGLKDIDNKYKIKAVELLHNAQK